MFRNYLTSMVLDLPLKTALLWSFTFVYKIRCKNMLMYKTEMTITQESENSVKVPKATIIYL